jgi:hypothetical protein
MAFGNRGHDRKPLLYIGSGNTPPGGAGYSLRRLELFCRPESDDLDSYDNRKSRVFDKPTNGVCDYLLVCWANQSAPFVCL